MAGENIKKKYLVFQISVKILKHHAIPKSSLQNLQIFHQKGPEKLVKHELCMELQSVTKLMRLATAAPLFYVGCKFALSFLATTA